MVAADVMVVETVSGDEEREGGSDEMLDVARKLSVEAVE